jgi:hypothetical protein
MFSVKISVNKFLGMTKFKAWVQKHRVQLIIRRGGKVDKIIKNSILMLRFDRPIFPQEWEKKYVKFNISINSDLFFYYLVNERTEHIIPLFLYK